MSYSEHDTLTPSAAVLRARIEYSETQAALQTMQTDLAIWLTDNWPQIRNCYTNKLEPLELARGMTLQSLVNDAALLCVSEVITENLADNVRGGLNILWDGEA